MDKYQILSDLVAKFNKTTESKYTIKSDDSGYVSIYPDGNWVAGALLKDVSALSIVYDWSFGVVPGIDGMYILI